MTTTITLKGLSSVLPQKGVASPPDETILPWQRNRPETRMCSDRFDQTTGFDHAGLHHQFILPSVLQDSVVRHSKAAEYLGLSGEARALGHAPIAFTACALPLRTADRLSRTLPSAD
jgi:hypothetical protein